LIDRDYGYRLRSICTRTKVRYVCDGEEMSRRLEVIRIDLLNWVGKRGGVESTSPIPPILLPQDSGIQHPRDHNPSLSTSHAILD
jgi:hypothetical protein